MKKLFFALCAGWLLMAGCCRAQESVSDAAPFLFVYVEKYGANVVPLIALGLETPALKINAVEKCVKMSAVNEDYAGLAVQLKPADAKTLTAAMKAAFKSDVINGTPRLLLWFTTPDNKVLGVVDSLNAEANISNAGVLDFDAKNQSAIISVLTEKLHLN